MLAPQHLFLSTPPLAFANNEVVVSFKLKKNKKPKNGQWKRLDKKVCKLLKDKKELEKLVYYLKPAFPKTPHLEYDVTLEVNGTRLNVATKPCPPSSPES